MREFFIVEDDKVLADGLARALKSEDRKSALPKMAWKKKRYWKSCIDFAEGKKYGIRKAWKSGFILPGKFYRERGCIKVYSEKDKGSVFAVFLPNCEKGIPSELL